jgi:hypothetical protein
MMTKLLIFYENGARKEITDVLLSQPHLFPPFTVLYNSHSQSWYENVQYTTPRKLEWEYREPEQINKHYRMIALVYL